jgi:hypothetical protein
MRGVTAQPVSGGEPASEPGKTCKNLLWTPPAEDAQPSVIRAQIDVIARLRPELANQVRGESNRERVAPSADPQRLDLPLDIHHYLGNV